MDGAVAQVGTPEQGVRFSAAERARIRNAVEDQAGGWVHNPVFHFGVEDAVRYVTEGASLAGLVERHGLRTVWEAVAAYVDEHPQVLDSAFTPTQIEARRAARREAALELSHQGCVAFKARDLDRACELIDRAEAIDPDADDWERIRAHIRKVRTDNGL